VPESASQTEADGFAEAALAKMRTLGVAPTPINYTIWYTYVSGHNRNLNDHVDALLASGKTFTEHLGRSIHDEFFDQAADAARILETSGHINEEVSRITELLDVAGGGAGAYGQALQYFSGQLEQRGGGDLRGLIGGVLSKTRHMQSQNQSLKGKLELSSHEIGQLRQDLEAVRREALTDPLTGVGNRRAFDSLLREFTTRAAEDKLDLCLILIDIDHFKHFNDTYGHQLGDNVIRLVARTIRQELRKHDVVTRFGGEEFGILLNDTPIATAYALGEAVRKSIAGKRVVRKTTGQEVSSITVSAGIALFRYDESLVSFIERSDEALYAAKNGGRNRTVTERDHARARAASG
jgi:diguanylate cyclase